jgi:hypothetical protein
MTGAIASVVAMSAMLGAPTEPGRPIAAPPSAAERTVRLTAQLPPRHRRSATRLVTAHTIHVQPRPEVTRSLVVVRPHSVHRRVQPRQLAAAKTQPAPPVASPAPAAVPAPAPAEPAPPPTGKGTDKGGESDPGHGHGHGHGGGRSDQDE